MPDGSNEIDLPSTLTLITAPAPANPAPRNTRSSPFAIVTEKAIRSGDTETELVNILQNTR